MEICPFCNMYMKPFIDRIMRLASCEFCGKVIATVEKNKWVKRAPHEPDQS